MSDDKAMREEELDELLGAYALDAVNDDERRAVEAYLLVNPRARAEVEEHREVASLLAWSGTAAPEGLWDRIAASLEEQAPPPAGELAHVLAHDGRRARRSRWKPVAAWAGMSAAAAMVAVLAVTIAQRDDDPSTLEAAVAAAREDRDSRVATLTAGDGRVGGEAIIDEKGHGFLIASELPALPADRTWQLWGVIDGEAISLGVLGSSPELEVFTVHGDVTQLVVTNEVAGGVITNGNMDGAYGGEVD